MSDLLIGTPNPKYNSTSSTQEFNIDEDSDLQFDVLGHLRLVEDDKKLVQEVGKILLTEQGTNIFEDRYGTILHSFVSSPITDETIFALIKQTILDAIGLLIGINQDNTNAKEKIATVESISATYGEEGTSSVTVELDLTTEAQKNVTTAIVLPILG